jgi:hypothetical protein
MKKAIFLTAYNRPQYFEQVLQSWQAVRGIEDWDIYVQIEPNAFAEEQADMVRHAFSGHSSVEVLINPQIYGVLHNPWVGFERLFMAKRYDFVVRGEDDLMVSADILEYFDFCSEKFKNDPSVAAVLGYTDDTGNDSHEIYLSDSFDPWVWGTWFDRWEAFLGPTWDHDYSTFNGQPGNQAGWDWNINTRLYPQHGLKSAIPARSRVHNIGVSGTHAIPEEYHTSPSYAPDHGKRDFALATH